MAAVPTLAGIADLAWLIDRAVVTADAVREAAAAALGSLAASMPDGARLELLASIAARLEYVIPPPPTPVQLVSMMSIARHHLPMLTATDWSSPPPLRPVMGC